MSEPNRKSPKRTNKQCLHCGEPVPAKVFHQRARVCGRCTSLPAVHVNGHIMRFCHLCRRFQSLDEFDENKKSCRRTLIAHNERRRRHRSEAAAVVQRPLYGAGSAAAAVTASRLAVGGELSGPEDGSAHLALMARAAQLDSEGSEETISESEAAAAAAAAGQPAGAAQQSFSDTGSGRQASNPRLPGLRQGQRQQQPQKPRPYWMEGPAVQHPQQVLPQVPLLEQQLSSGGAGGGGGNDRFFAEVLAAVPELRALLPEQQLLQQAGSRGQPAAAAEAAPSSSLGAAEVDMVVQLLVTLLERLVAEARPATSLRPTDQPAPIEPALSSALSSLCLLLEAHQTPSQTFSQQLLPPPGPPPVRLPDMAAAAAALGLHSQQQRELAVEQPLLPAFGSGAAATLPSFGSGGAFTPYVPRDLSGRLPSASSSDMPRLQPQQPPPPQRPQQPELLLLELASRGTQAAAEQAQHAQREPGPVQQPTALCAAPVSGRPAQSVSCQWQPGAVPQSPFVGFNVQPANGAAAALGPLAAAAAQPQQAAATQQLYQQLSLLLLRQQEQERLQQGQQQLLPGHLASGELQSSIWRGAGGRSAAHS